MTTQDAQQLRTAKETGLIVALCIISGFGFWAAGYMISIEDAPVPHEQAIEGYGVFSVLELPIGLLAWLLLPMAIAHDPAELRVHNPIPGRRRTFWAAIVVVLCGFTFIAAPASIVAAVSMMSRSSSAWSAAVVATTVASTFLSLLWDPFAELRGSSAGLGFTAVVMTLTLVVLMWIGQYRSRRRENLRLWKAEASAARADERTRIARDMHDTLSHRLSLIAVHAGVLEQQPDWQVRAEVAATIKQQAAAAVNDLRDVVGLLRSGGPGEETDPLAEVEKTIADARAAGQSIEFVGDIRALGELSTPQQHLVNRVLTEGLTNARKHAPGAVVVVESRNNLLEVKTLGVPKNRESDGQRSGFGLIGLRERARIVGAKLTVEHKNGNHILKVIL